MQKSRWYIDDSFEYTFMDIGTQKTKEYLFTLKREVKEGDKFIRSYIPRDDSWHPASMTTTELAEYLIKYADISNDTIEYNGQKWNTVKEYLEENDVMSDTKIASVEAPAEAIPEVPKNIKTSLLEVF